VEAALLVPFLVLMLFGLIEYGVGWSASNSVSDAVGTASLDLSRGYGERSADLRVLEQLRSSPGELDLDAIDWVIVYRTAAADGAPPPACVTAAEALTSGSGGVSATCTAYHGSAVASLTAADFGDTSCVGDPDADFCPSTRQALLVGGTRLGVAIQVSHGWLTGMFPGPGLTLSDHAVAEPID
jgi:hypothetical protein